MLEPLIVLTVLNCVFMFSSTITTCALWWQYHHHLCCTKRNSKPQKLNLKRSKGSHTIHTSKKPGKSEFDGYADNSVVNKSSINTNYEHKSKNYLKKRSRKNLNYLSYEKQDEDNNILNQDRAGIRKLNERTKLSEATQTINDKKSTVVMEFSTVQKLVQIVDNEPDVNSAKVPFKDNVVRKDKAEKERDLNVEFQD